MTKKLVILAHPNIDKSSINKRLKDSIKNIKGVNIHELYKEYPDFKINVEKEQKLLLDSDIIIFQFPFYWYSSPSLLKEWQDKVLTWGFAYGDKGKALNGKKMLIVLSTGGPKEAYFPGGYNKYTISELLKPFQATANLCGMEYLTPLVISGVHKVSEKELEEHIKRYQEIIKN